MPPFSDRGYWDSIRDLPSSAKLIKTAEGYAAEPTPELTEEMHSEFRRTGWRKGFENPYQERMRRLHAFLFAFGLTQQPKWMDLFQKELNVVLDEPSWALPSHTRSRATWDDARDYIDLAAASKAWSMGTIEWLMGDMLPQATRERIRTEVSERVLQPWIARMRSGHQRDFWWMNVEHNWNAVCNSGVLGAALLLLDDPKDRAEYVAAYEQLAPRYLSGFAEDGFCFEGISYWSYGFGQFGVAAEMLRLATDGEINLLDDPHVRNIARFGYDWQIANGLYPAFADVAVYTRVPQWMNNFVNFNFNGGVGDAEPSVMYHNGLGGHFHVTVFNLALFREGQTPAIETEAVSTGELPLHSWFPDGGGLVSRSNPANKGLSVAFKGGSNTHSHHHVDLGSFVVLVDGQPVLTDLGHDDYVRETFGPNRYTYDLMSSYGHPVPRVAGRLQQDGAASQAITKRLELTDEQDIWEFDLTTAYSEVPELEEITRTFIFTRGEGGKLEIIDRVRFSSPQDFGNALILRPNTTMTEIGENLYRVDGDRGGAVQVAFEVDEGNTIAEERTPVKGIIADRPPKGHRVGFNLEKPARTAEIRTVITPLPEKTAAVQ